MPQFIIPQNYQEWRHCITDNCRLELTSDYIEQRINALQEYDPVFLQLYGKQHWQQTLEWLNRAQQEL